MAHFPSRKKIGLQPPRHGPQFSSLPSARNQRVLLTWCWSSSWFHTSTYVQDINKYRVVFVCLKCVRLRLQFYDLFFSTQQCTSEISPRGQAQKWWFAGCTAASSLTVMSSSWRREPHGMRPWPLLAHSLPVFGKVERAAWCEMGAGKEAIFGGVLVPTTL